MRKDEKWNDKGYKGSSFNVATPFLNSGHEHDVENTETGEQRTIQVNSNQTLEEAIKTNKQWSEDRKNDELSEVVQTAVYVNKSENSTEKEYQTTVINLFSDEEIVALLLESTDGQRNVQEICRSKGISEFTYYRLQARYGGMTLRQIKRMRKLEAENARLKRVVIELNMAADNWRFQGLKNR